MSGAETTTPLEAIEAKLNAVLANAYWARVACREFEAEQQRRRQRGEHLGDADARGVEDCRAALRRRRWETRRAARLARITYLEARLAVTRWRCRLVRRVGQEKAIATA